MAAQAHLPTEASNDERPVLHLSGATLRGELEGLIAACEPVGGIEAFVEAVKLKTALFQDLLADGKAAALSAHDFEQLCSFMATCRRRIAAPLDTHGYAYFQDAIVRLLDGAADATTADVRLGEFVKAFPQDKSHRWVRDLAAELLHHVLPEHYPLMTRWVWDTKANSGVLREIWHGENVDHMVIDIPDGYQTFLVLREEFSQFLSENGVFRDMLFFVDLLQAHIYGGYVNAQGGSFLRTDFATEGDPLEHTRRILGLDGVNAKTGRSKFKTIDGSAHVIADVKQLS